MPGWDCADRSAAGSHPPGPASRGPRAPPTSEHGALGVADAKTAGHQGAAWGLDPEGRRAQRRALGDTPQGSVLGRIRQHQDRGIFFLFFLFIFFSIVKELGIFLLLETGKMTHIFLTKTVR